jgi:hypothetical protein
VSASRVARVLLGLVILACAAGALTLYIGHTTSQRPVAAARIQKVAATSQDRILFVGASYTEGLGATPRTNGYAYLAAHDMGWQARIDAIPGTGYLNPGPPIDGQHKDGTFATRLAHISSTPAPEILVLQGGRNDSGYPMQQLRDAVEHTVAVAKSRFTHARIVLLGPIPASFPPNRGELDVAREMRIAARASGADFVDPISEGWITVENEVGYVGHVPAHPDNAGYAYIAKKLVVDLDQLMGASPEPSASANRTSS